MIYLIVTRIIQSIVYKCEIFPIKTSSIFYEREILIKQLKVAVHKISQNTVDNVTHLIICP